MLVQLHWQDRQNPEGPTEFVGQADPGSMTEMGEWARDLLERRLGECPEGWVPCIMTGGDPRFVYAAPPAECAQTGAT